MDILKYYENLLLKYFQYDEKLIELIQLLGNQSVYSKEEISYLETIKTAFEEISQNREIYNNQSLNIPWWEYPYMDIGNRLLNKYRFDVLHQDVKVLLNNYFSKEDYNFFYLIVGDGDVGIDFVGKMLIFLLDLDEHYKNLMNDSYFIKKILDTLSYKINYKKTEQFLTVAKIIRGNECRYIPLIRKLYIKMLLLEVSEEFYQEYIAQNPDNTITPPLNKVEEFIIWDFEQHVGYLDNKNTLFFEKRKIEKNYVSCKGSWYPFCLLGTKFVRTTKKLVNETEAWAEEYNYLMTTS